MTMKMQAGARVTDRTWNGDAVGGVVLSICPMEGSSVRGAGFSALSFSTEVSFSTNEAAAFLQSF